MKLYLLLLLFALVSVPAGAEVAIKYFESSLDVSDGSAAVLIVNNGNEAVSGPVHASIKGGAVQAEKRLTVAADGYEIFPMKIEMGSGNMLHIEYMGAKADITLSNVIDLTNRTWKRNNSSLFSLSDPAPAQAGYDTSDWSETSVPAMWNEEGVTWNRCMINIPESLRGIPMYLEIGSVDDNDSTWFNGVKIGETTGWDKHRLYEIPADKIKYGEDNLLAIAVENLPGSGGGIVNLPIRLNAGGAKEIAEAKQPVSLPKAGRIGEPLPVRPIHAENGVLKYPEGTEVALWGTNYYPMSWYQYVNMQTALKEGKTEITSMKEAIDKDLDHIKSLGLDIVRVHIFDREMSGPHGELVENEHLDLQDYLIAGAIKRNMYVYITLIGWWFSPVQLDNSFSALYTKPETQFNPRAKAAAAAFSKNILTHVNPYSGTRLCDEKALAVLELENEPFYFVYGDLRSPVYPRQGETEESVNKARELFRITWQKWLERYGLQDKSCWFPLFSYCLEREYIDEMIEAVRSTGAKQPIAVNHGFAENNLSLEEAIADSEVDAVTNSAYPGGLNTLIDGKNLLPQYSSEGLMEMGFFGHPNDGRLDHKARVMYEFDNDGSNHGTYMYPAMAAAFRSRGVQIACQFQYDTLVTAGYNTDWGTHFVNRLYTPARAVSLCEGGYVFRSLPRGIRPAVTENDIRTDVFATDFCSNMSVYSENGTYIHTRTASRLKAAPAAPENPRCIIGTGSDELVDYGGTGLWQLTFEGDEARLVIEPDAVQLGNCMNSAGFASPIVVLEENTQLFRLKLKGWENCTMTKNGEPVEKTSAGFVVRPGEYIIKK